MIKINVIVGNKSWKKYIKNPKVYVKNKIRLLKKNNNFFKNKNIHFSLLLSDNKEIKKINNKFRKKNKTTDVLSFPLKYITKNNIYIGDIAISFEIINKRSRISNFNYEFDKMWIHGYLHLAGYDHKKNKDYKKMNKKELLILNYLNK